MKNLFTKWGATSFLGICLISSFSYAANANTGSAITGDGGGGNIDSSTFGDFFVPSFPNVSPTEGVSGVSGVSAFSAGGVGAVDRLPPNWKCLSRPVCPDCDLRLETLAKMLDTNLSGTLTRQVIQGSAPRFCCDPSVASRAVAHQEVSLLGGTSSTTSNSTSTEAFRVASGGSSAALLDGVKPASLETSLPAATTIAQTTAPVADSGRRNRLDPFPAAPNTSASANQLQQELQQALNLQSDPTDPTKTQSVKLQTLRDLVTTLQGLIWEERLGNNTQQIQVDVEQLAAAIKTYNQFLTLLSPQELNAWRNDRNGLDVTTVLKKLREGVTVTQ